ncbi:GNAT family N-acetyltransferase [Streptomyces sp. NPDC052396]|uniref:GNAT family N-acetyltransferase n=1 Tax=Streptomyces sp. NPDC052396 TaxID=3365689 RepID=UPI0037D5CC7C
MTDVCVELRHYDGGEVAVIRGLLLDVHDEVYLGSEDPLAGRDKFAEFLDHWADRPGFDCVVGYEGGEAVGYAYGAPLSAETSWWSTIEPCLDSVFSRETGSRTFALSELMVRAPWRGTGLARRIHDELVCGRHEERATLLVHQAHSKVRSLYETWGYRVVGAMTPSFPGAPDLYAMVGKLGARQ